MSRTVDVFTGEDLVKWLKDKYSMDTSDEAVHLGLKIKCS